MSKLCYACREKPGAFSAKVYHQNGSGTTILLCKDHDIELYKVGQLKFVQKYDLKVREASENGKPENDDVLGDFA